MTMLEKPLIFVDVETTGVNFSTDRIIEIGIVKSQNGEILETYESLVNPDRQISPFIAKLTGISQHDLSNAPKFAQIQEEVGELISDNVIVAHNASFDYGFLSSEFSGTGVDFTNPYLCSVSLSRMLFPSERRHGLDKIIERFELEVEARHRALADAKAIHLFFTELSKKFTKKELEAAIKRLLRKRNTLASGKERYADLPKSSGIYIFYDELKHPLYIGKSVNIKNRVRSHFKGDHSYFAGRVKKIETIPTAGELGALIRESVLIKNSYPVYNVQLRHNRSFLILKREVDKDGFINLKPSELPDITTQDFETFFGIFKSRKSLEQILVRMAKSCRLCYRYLGLDKSKNSCFSYQLGICSGACAGKEEARTHNGRLLKAFSDYQVIRWPYPGAIEITEKNGELEETFTVDNWCLVKTSSTELQLDKSDKLTFDMDIYKILKRYLHNSKNKNNVKILSTKS